MEQDRYTYHKKLFILGIISLILALTLFFFSIYILPFLLWTLPYDVPDFTLDLIAYFEDEFNYSLALSKTIVELLFLIPGLIFGYCSYLISNYIDNDILHINPTEETEEGKKESVEIKREVKESLGLAAKIIILMVIIVVIILLLQQFIFLTS